MDGPITNRRNYFLVSTKKYLKLDQLMRFWSHVKPPFMQLSSEAIGLIFYIYIYTPMGMISAQNDGIKRSSPAQHYNIHE